MLGAFTGCLRLPQVSPEGSGILLLSWGQSGRARDLRTGLGPWQATFWPCLTALTWVAFGELLDLPELIPHLENEPTGLTSGLFQAGGHLEDLGAWAEGSRMAAGTRLHRSWTGKAWLQSGACRESCIPGAFSGPAAVLSIGLGHASPGDSKTQPCGLVCGALNPHGFWSIPAQPCPSHHLLDSLKKCSKETQLEDLNLAHT